MKVIILTLLLAQLWSCTQHREEPSDDYVLIEFASKLEEDYQKLAPPETQPIPDGVTP